MVHQIGCHLSLIDAIHKANDLSLQTSDIIGLKESKDLHEGVVTKDMSLKSRTINHSIYYYFVCFIYLILST